MNASSSEPDAPSLKAAAVSGSVWSGMQMVVNKATSLVGTLVTMYLIAPDAFGVVAVATSILSYVTVLPAFTLSDVLLARPKSVAETLPAAARLCAATTAGSILLLLGVGFACSQQLGDLRIWHASLLLAIRPFGDLLMLGPQTVLRVRLDFRAMSQVDAVVQCIATVGSVTLAAFGAGYVSLVLPHALALLVRALVYARLAQGWGATMHAGDAGPHPWRALLWDYGLSGLGQYVHGGLIVAPPLVLAVFCSKEIVGYFSTAFALSASFNSVVAVGLGLVLQPVFAHMGTDVARQRRAFGRACSVIAAVSMPACICQAICVAPAFRLAMPAVWQDAIVFAQLLSLGQAMYFVVNPAMGLLKAQGRFKAFFVWQTVQLVLVIGGMAACGVVFAEPELPIVAVYSFYHVAFSPIGLALCIPRGQGLGAAIREVFVSPLAASAAALAPVVMASWLLPVHPGIDIALLVAAPAAVFTTYPLFLRKLAPETYGDCRDAFKTVLRRQTKAAC
jgi:O-antigen/teichoic acid export membrane protein